MNQVPDIDMGYIDSDSDSETSAQSSYLPSAASSRMFLSSQSGTDLKSSSSRIYKPREPVSRRNSLKKSPSSKQTLLPEAALATAAPLLGEQDPKNHQNATFYISRSDLNKVTDEKEADTVTVDMSTLKIDSLRESVI